MLYAKLLKDVECVLCLVHSKAGRVALELHSKVSLNRTEIVRLEVLMKVSLELSNQLSVTACKENVIHIH